MTQNCRPILPKSNGAETYSSNKTEQAAQSLGCARMLMLRNTNTALSYRYAILYNAKQC